MTYCYSISKYLLFVTVETKTREREKNIYMYLVMRKEVKWGSVQDQIMEKELDKL